jgi:hypothetical protein
VLEFPGQSAKSYGAVWQLLRQAQTPEVRRYAVKELARRAGVTSDFFDSWEIQCLGERTTVTLISGSSKQIHFDCAPEEDLARTANGDFPIAKTSYPIGYSNLSDREDLVVPFCKSAADQTVPLFQRQLDGSYLCPLDLLFSVVLTLSRVEECLCSVRDLHDRFPASSSVATKFDFLERPIIDEYGLAFEQVLRELVPSWRPGARTFSVKLTHDIDSIGIPLQLRTTVGHTLKRRRPGSTFQDLLAHLSEADPSELRLVRRLAEISRSRGLHSAFYWKGSPQTQMDDGYDPFHPKVQRVIANLRDQGFEMGAHPGYYTFRAPPELRNEVERLRAALGSKNLGGRQHYLRWSPETWLDWEASGLVYDTTVGFADRIGFRAGTSFAYRPWSLAENRELNLIEIPLIVMDCTPVKYMGLPRAEGLERVRKCIERIRKVGGTFTMLWHNVPLMEPEYQGWYEPILDMLGDSRPFTLPTAEALW